jgi:hypothetical protein
LKDISKEDELLFLIDTGADISLLEGNKSIRTTEYDPEKKSERELEIEGTQEVKFKPHNWRFGHQFCVCTLPTEANGILGMDFLPKRNVEVNLGRIRAKANGLRY